MLKKILKVAAIALSFIVLSCVPSHAQTTAFFSDRAVGQFPVNHMQVLIPIAYGQVRVCTLPTSGSPCATPANGFVFDLSGNPATVSGGNFGQFTTDVVGRFSFGCTPGSYQVQVAAGASNTPSLSYPITCPIPGSVPPVNVAFNNVTAAGLTVTGASSLSSVTATTGIFSGLITPNGGIAAFNGVTGDFINAGIFTNAAPNPNLQSIINSCSLTTEETALFGVSAFTSEAVTGCLQIPNTSTAAAFGSGASGYANTSSTTTPAVGIFGGGRALVNNSKAWGANVIAQDVAGLTVGVALTGLETDVTPTNASTAYTSVNGQAAIIGAGAHTGTFGDAHVATSNKAGAIWTNGFHSGAGAATQALTADKLAAAGVTASQPIVFVSNNGGADITASLATDSAGDFVATLPASGFFQAARVRIPEETTAFPSLHDATTTNTGLNFRGGVLELVKAGTASLQAFGAGIIVDTEIRFALGSVDVTSATAGLAECASGVVCASNVGNNSNGVFKAASFTSGGAAAGLAGTGACATFSTQSGGAMAGQATCTGVTAASTLTITPGTTAPNGWVCHVQDQTTRANLFQQTGNNPTTCTLTATSVTQNDVFVFTAIAF